MLQFESQWDAAWAHVEAQPWYPDEQVVRFFAQNYARRLGPKRGDVAFKSGRRPRGLDLGCGKGRHLVTMAEHGIDAYGSDISTVALSFARQWLDELGLAATLAHAGGSAIDAATNSFDIVICHGVLDHILADERHGTNNEVFRVLKPGGAYFFSVISTRDCAYGSGQPTGEADTWYLAEGYEKSLPQAFFDEARIRSEFADFDITNLTHVEVETLAGRSLIGSDKQYPKDSRFYVLARKPA